MYRGLYKEKYALFENSTPPETITGAPFGVTAFTDERNTYFLTEGHSKRHQNKILEEINSRKMPHYFDLLVNLRCNVSSFADETFGMQAKVFLREICDIMFVKTPIVKHASGSSLADALIALSLEGGPVETDNLGKHLIKSMTRFPQLFYLKSPAMDTIKDGVNKSVH